MDSNDVSRIRKLIYNEGYKLVRIANESTICGACALHMFKPRYTCRLIDYCVSGHFKEITPVSGNPDNVSKILDIIDIHK